MVAPRFGQAVPDSALVELQIGDYLVSPLPPKHFQSLEYERVSDGGNKLSLTLYDNTAIELEEIIARGYLDVKFSYGYLYGARSPRYKGQVIDYSFQMQAGGSAVLSITAVSQGFADFKPRVRQWKDADIHQIVASIAAMEGWDIGYIEPTRPIMVARGSSSDLVKKPYIQDGVISVKFIKTVLAADAVSLLTGEGGYQLYFTDSGDRPKIYFAPPNFSRTPLKQFVFEWNSSNQDVVLSFAPDFKGIVRAAQGAGVVKANFVDEFSNELSSVSYDQDSNPNQRIVGSRVPRRRHFLTLLNTSSGDPNELRQKAAVHWYKMANQSYPATLEIRGDPHLEVGMPIMVVPLTRDGLPHHTAGVYIILGATDSVQGGHFTTSLVLQRNAARLGPSEVTGVEVG